MSIRSLTIGKRPTLGFGLIGLLVLFLGLFAMNQMANMREEAGESGQRGKPGAGAVGDRAERGGAKFPGLICAKEEEFFSSGNIFLQRGQVTGDLIRYTVITVVV